MINALSSVFAFCVVAGFVTATHRGSMTTRIGGLALALLSGFGLMLLVGAR